MSLHTGRSIWKRDAQMKSSWRSFHAPKTEIVGLNASKYWFPTTRPIARGATILDAGRGLVVGSDDRIRQRRAKARLNASLALKFEFDEGQRASLSSTRETLSCSGILGR